MSIYEYFKDKLIFLVINFILFTVVAFILVVLNFNVISILMIFVIWFMPLIGYMVMQLIKFKKYYAEINQILSMIEKKYLLTEVISEPDFIEGTIIFSILREISRDMHENVKYYRDMQKEYREYIETWVHEIKTPIASTKLIIENNPCDSTQKIEVQIDKIEDFIEQVLYYSRSDDVSKDYIIKKFELIDVINNVLTRNYRDFINKRIKLNIGSLNEVVCSDAKWLEFIINQIISNSIKYSKEKNAMISIHTKVNKNSVVLSIEDNGVGIVEKDINRVFDKGFTGENGRIYGRSTGIGLYLCKSLCNKLGLGVSINSEYNKGTKVEIIIPKLNRE